MTFRSRLLVAFLLAAVVPLVLLALFVRNEMTRRMTAQYEHRVESLVEVIEEDLSAEREKIAASLEVLCGAVVDDNRFRRAAVDGDREERRYLLDYAGDAMRLAGLSMLQIQDPSGRIISSGHFRNEYDRMEPELPRLLSAVPGATAVVPARAPGEPFLALASVDSFQMGGKKFWMVAGVRLGQRFLGRLERGADMNLALVYPGGVLSLAPTDEARGPSAIVRELSVPFVDPSLGEPTVATIRVSHRLDELHALRKSIDRWFAAAVAAAVVLAVVLAGWLASRISRPLVDLADKTARIDLDRLDVDFDTDRGDEIGALSRLLGAMTGRLRASAVRIRDAERRATVGELARQVNHDVKNGLTPIRNVFRHLAQLARSDPDRLSRVFEEREGTLDSSISYLENLASNYARLYPRGERRPCAINEIVEQVVADLRGPGQTAALRTDLADKPVVAGDPLSIRRVLENLLNNAIDSLRPGGTVGVEGGAERPGARASDGAGGITDEGAAGASGSTAGVAGEGTAGASEETGAGARAGEVAVATEIVETDSGRRVRIVVSDTGAGMGPEEREKIFDDFYTTKEGGTGLGLSIVRRLVMDLDGTIDVESEPGRGSRFIVELPETGPAGSQPHTD